MAATVKFTVPSGKKVYVQGFTSARYKQRATITGGGAGRIMLKGQGSGRTTPPGKEFMSNGGDVTVTIEHDSGSGWVRSGVKEAETAYGQNVLQLVYSEDGVDNDYNDLAVVFYYTTHN